MDAGRGEVSIGPGLCIAMMSRAPFSTRSTNEINFAKLAGIFRVFVVVVFVV